ncbi:PLP-dependent aminotransferase family protein [Thioalkalivibrio denitrificans]|nr:PLP-dependent aminotransferase family protein [Thioalkalivibrio denitrificans]
MISENTDPRGDNLLRRQIARRTAALGLDCRAEDIVITSGGLEAMTLALRAVAEVGDAIAVESPCSAATLGVLRSLGLAPVEVHATPEHGILLDQLEDILTTREIRACLFSTNCADPLGYVMPEPDKRVLMHILAHHGVPLVENDVLGDLAYGARPSPAAAFAANDNVLVCSSFTYTLGSGLRLGWLAPGKYRARVLELKAASSVAPPPLIQRAVAEYLQGSGFERHLRALRRALEAQTDDLAQAVRASFPGTTRLYRPAGGSALWIELPPGADACLLQERSPRTVVDWVPGCRFTTSPTLCNFMRLPATDVRGHALDARIAALATQVGGTTF